MPFGILGRAIVLFVPPRELCHCSCLRVAQDSGVRLWSEEINPHISTDFATGKHETLISDIRRLEPRTTFLSVPRETKQRQRPVVKGTIHLFT